MKQLLEEYKSIGDDAKLEKLLLKNYNKDPFIVSRNTSVVNFYYNRKQFSEALVYVDKSIRNAPYCSDFWMNRSYVHNGMGLKEQEMTDLSNAIRKAPGIAGQKNHPVLSEKG
jgi:tetratricopeptide (TPR) repeat protein